MLENIFQVNITVMDFSLILFKKCDKAGTKTLLGVDKPLVSSSLYYNAWKHS
jgi:hypothetical protein